MAVPIVLSIVISAVLIYVVLPNVELLPVQASAEAVMVDQLFDLEFAALAAIFTLVMVFFLYSILVFRRRGEDDDEEGEPIHGNAPLEIAWTIAPVAIVVAFGVYAAGVLDELTPGADYDLEVKVTAQQWSWSFEYPEGFTSSELMLPAGQKILFTMTSVDVIHSFWVPEFRVKQDVVPGMETQLVSTPTEVGDYQILCAELCGLQHAYMTAPIQVVEPGDYDAWVEEQLALLAAGTPVERGQRASEEFGCAACHSLDGSVIVGPTWLNTFGSMEALADGSTVEVDEAYLLESILDPNAKVVEGFQPDIMPKDFGERMSEQQIDDVIDYIKSLAQ